MDVMRAEEEEERWKKGKTVSLHNFPKELWTMPKLCFVFSCLRNHFFSLWNSKFNSGLLRIKSLRVSEGTFGFKLLCADQRKEHNWKSARSHRRTRLNLEELFSFLQTQMSLPHVFLFPPPLMSATLSTLSPLSPSFWHGGEGRKWLLA